MEDNQLWALFWKCSAAVLIAAAVSVGGCTAYESRLVANAIEGGADPIDARCAIAGSTGPREACLLRAANK